MVSDVEVTKPLLEKGLVDWVSLHDVVWHATHGNLSPESKARTLRVLQQLFDEGLMVPGELAESGFVDWPSPKEWLSRAASELERVSWTPMGEGFWLRLTERGEAQTGGCS